MRRNKLTPKYSPEFKASVILDMREHRLSDTEANAETLSTFVSKEFCFFQEVRAHIPNGRKGKLYDRAARFKRFKR